MEKLGKASIASEFQNFTILTILPKSILNMGATPLWGGAREPKEEASG